jgi:hypothetical protein
LRQQTPRDRPKKLLFPAPTPFPREKAGTIANISLQFL